MLPAMSYTILKMHKSKAVYFLHWYQLVSTSKRLKSLICLCVIAEHLMKLSMEELVEFLQVTLSKDFFFEDDFVIEQLQASMTELRRAKLELPAPGTDTV